MRKPLIALVALMLLSGAHAQATTDGASSQQVFFALEQYRFNKEITLPTGVSVPQIANFPRDLRNFSVSVEKVITTTPTLRDNYIVKNVDAQLPLTKRPAPKIVQETGGEMVIHASAYTAAADETGSGNGITASGARVQQNRTLACPPQYRFGTKVKIEGYGTYTCEDRGGAIKGNHFDIYMETKSEAFAFGRRRLVAYVAL